MTTKPPTAQMGWHELDVHNPDVGTDDEEAFLLWIPAYGIRIGAFDQDAGSWRPFGPAGFSKHFPDVPTHWCPMPPPMPARPSNGCWDAAKQRWTVPVPVHVYNADDVVKLAERLLEVAQAAREAARPARRTRPEA